MNRTTTEEPTFLIGEVAKIFNKGIPWLRWYQTKPEFCKEDGSPIEIGRTDSPVATVGRRRYTIENLEDMAGAFLRGRKLTQIQYDRIMKTIDGFKGDSE